MNEDKELYVIRQISERTTDSFFDTNLYRLKLELDKTLEDIGKCINYIDNLRTYKTNQDRER